MRVPGEASQILIWNIVAEVIKQQKRVEVRGVAKAESAAKVNARAFDSRLGFDEPLNWSNGHVSLLCK